MAMECRKSASVDCFSSISTGILVGLIAVKIFDALSELNEEQMFNEALASIKE